MSWFLENRDKAFVEVLKKEKREKLFSYATTQIMKHTKYLAYLGQ